MKIHQSISLIIFANALIGCAGNKGMRVTDVVPIQEASVAGTALDSENMDNLRYDDSYKQYPVGRKVDPNDPDVMHEANVIYRREAPEAWNTSPNTPVAVNMGPAVAVSHPAEGSMPTSADLEQKTVELQRVLEITAEQNERMAAELAKTQKSNEKMEEFMLTIQKEREEKAQLANELATLKAQTQAAEEERIARAKAEKDRTFWDKVFN